MARSVRPHRLMSLGAAVLAAFLTACGGEQIQGESDGLGTRAAALEGGESAPRPKKMIVYSTREKVDDSKFVWLGPPEAMGGQVLEGNPRLYGRIDYNNGGVTAGIFKATKGKIRVTFPFSEHATILEGKVTITDESGQSHTFKEGDSYFIRQGQVVIWEVKGKEVIKSFYNVVE
ncbi:cupin domain-containing protein [Archangium minus]